MIRSSRRDTAVPNTTDEVARLRVTLGGAVQGVGFRPFVYRLATELGLRGWVRNTGAGAHIELEGARGGLESFLLRLEPEKPPRCFLQGVETTWLDPASCTGFEIRESVPGPASAIILPDTATCPECLEEVLDASNRRYGYPFTNCTNCGPRFSIIEALPYDRANTSMRAFRMCPECQAEYDDPSNRRFHAQPNACPVCGPQIELWDVEGRVLARAADALAAAVRALKSGAIVAIKGLGGFQLLVHAGAEESVVRLRRLKHREEKPFALMFPSLEVTRRVCETNPFEERLLLSPESPIVLLRRRAGSAATVAASAAPGNPDLGAMLPYTPLHHLLLQGVDAPVVATSGNLSDEPICIDEKDALARLGPMSDLLLVHNRPIVRHVDDSVARVVAGRELVLRRARGYAPLPIPLPGSEPRQTVLAVGAHLKNSVAVTRGSQVFISQHIGDLETAHACDAFTQAVGDLARIYEVEPTILAADLHPDYASTRWATQKAAGSSIGLLQVQHHYAHVLSCMAENELSPPALGVAWDGTGLGTDGTIWGGEFLLIRPGSFRRFAWLRPFPLPGGEQAVREPRRCALGLLFEHLGEAAFKLEEVRRCFSAAELPLLQAMLRQGVNCPKTSSMGRLFDAVASLLNLRQRTAFEGQAAMDLEFAADRVTPGEVRSLVLRPMNDAAGPAYEADWGPLLEWVLADAAAGADVHGLAGKFHEALVELVLQVADRAGERNVVLSGGCFQNIRLLEALAARLGAAGYKAYWHQRVPPNDGGICLGQVVAALQAKV